MSSVDIQEAKGVFAQPWSLKKAIGLLAVFGPAAIVASVSIGAGETIVVVRMGAWAGYGLLWLVLLSCVVKGVFVTYLVGRYTAISGEYIGHRLVRLPGPRGWLLIALILFEMFGAPLAWVPIAKPCGDLLHFLFRDSLTDMFDSEIFWENLFTTAFIAMAMWFGLRLSFERLEKQQLVICGILVTGTVMGTMLVRPDLVKTLIGSLSFGDMPAFPSWAPQDAIDHPMLTMATTFGYVGGSVFAYIAYSNWIGLHGWGLTGHRDIEAIRKRAFESDSYDYLPDDVEQAGKLRRLTASLRWDVGLGAVVLFVVSAAFMLSGAAVLYPLESRFEGWGLLTEQAHVWRNIHPTLVWIYYVCIIAALWGTLQALPEIYARVMQEFLQAIWPDRDWNYDRLKRRICLYIFTVAVIIIWLNIPFDILIQIAGFIMANFAIALIMVAAVYLNFKLPPMYRTNGLVLTGAILSVAILAAFAAISGWGLAAKLLG
ncbi:MAG: Nramp family divalent metal transporter [Candidatus Latescibacterota bacterium]